MGRRKKQKKKFLNGDVAIVALVIIGILLGILIYAETGSVGQTLSPMLGGLMGFIKYLLPIVTFGLAIYIAADNKEYIISKFIQMGIVVICITTVLSIYQISIGHITDVSNFSKAVSQGYELGSKNIGGGAIGTIVAAPLCNMLGNVGAAIVAIGVIAVIAVYIFGIKPSRILADAVEHYEENKEEKARKRELKDQLREDKKGKKEMAAGITDISEEQITINLGKNKKQADKKSETEAQKNQEFDTINLFTTQQEEKEEKTKEVLQLEHTITVEDENYEFPPIELLAEIEGTAQKSSKKSLTEVANKLQKTLYSFGVSAKVEKV